MAGFFHRMADLRGIAALALAWLIGGPALAQLVTGPDLVLAPKALDGEFFRSDNHQVTLGLRLDPAGALTLAAMTVTIRGPQGEQDFPIEAAEQMLYDPQARTLRATFRRNDPRVRALEGTLGVEAREFHQVRTFRGTLTFDSGRTMPVAMTGTLNTLMGKPGCVFDLFAGASLSAITLKRPYEPGKPDWLQPIAAAENWKVLRRRIDYVRAEEEYDIATGAGRALAALAIIRTLPEVACLSFGADEGDGDMTRIIGIPRGTVQADTGPVDMAALWDRLVPAFAGATVALQAAGPDGAFQAQVTAPGRFFGLTQFGQESCIVTIRFVPGLGPTGAGDIRDMLRIGLLAVARQTGGTAQPLDLRATGPGSADVILQEWWPRVTDQIATLLGGTLN